MTMPFWHPCIGYLVHSFSKLKPGSIIAFLFFFARAKAAVVSNTVNSNMINLVFGLVLPSLVIGMGSAAGDGVSISGGCLA
jgi:hypothetical protein